MKNFVITIVAMLTVVSFAHAQSCDEFVGANAGKNFVYVNNDAKGNEMGRVSYSAVKKDPSTITIHSEVTDKKGKQTGTADFDMNCTGSTIKVDMRSFIPAGSNKEFSNMEMVADGKYLVYPLNLKAGDKLDDGSMLITINNKGSKFGEMNIDITDRTVEQTETVNSAAGNFDCFRISYNILIKAKVMGIGIPVNMKVTEWYSPKLGRFVKSETYNKNGKFMGTTTLASVN